MKAARRFLEAVCFLLRFPWPRGRRALPATLPCGARTFLHRGACEPLRQRPPFRLGRRWPGAFV